MKRPDAKSVVAAIVAVVSLAGSVVGLVANVPKVSESPWGPPILGVIVFGSLCYLVYFVYISFLKAYVDSKRRLNQIKNIILEYISNHADEPLNGRIDRDLINTIEATKLKANLPLEVTGTSFLANGNIEIIIDKGFEDGLLDGMQAKVFHSAQMTEIGRCDCTVFHDRATLVVAVGPTCPINLGDIRPNTIRVALIEPPDHCRINALLASLLYELDR